jgi:hypothetical protein
VTGRPELAVRGGYPQPLNLPPGEFRCRLVNGEMVLDHADPRILISAELLETMEQDPADWCAWVDVSGCKAGNFVGGLLKVNAVNRNVVYLITESVPEVNGYIGEWPE